MTGRNKQYPKQANELLINPRDAVENYLADFFLLRGGGNPLFPLSFFWAQGLYVKGGGVPPNSVKEKNPLKDSYFWPKKRLF